MDNQACFSAMPKALVSKVLWSRDLHLLDRLRCQEVCKTWQSILQEGMSGVEKSSLSPELCVKFVDSGNDQHHIAPQLDHNPPTILVVAQHEAASCTSKSFFTAWCQCVLRKASLVRTIELTGQDIVPWQLREVVKALQVAHPPAIELKVPSGFAFLQEYEELLVNKLVVLHFQTELPDLHRVAKMTNLTYLTLRGSNKDGDRSIGPPGNELTLLHSLTGLHTLDIFGFQQLHLLDFQRLGSLRKLCLGTDHTGICDVSSCTQLTSLAISWEGNPPKHVLLPAGSNVQLRHLLVSAVHFYGNCGDIQTLQDSTQLTCIEFLHTYPPNFDQVGWPISMPCLNTIKADMVPGLPPQQMINYSRLRHLDISLSGDRYVPNWFSQLTQLETLTLKAAHGMTTFPMCVLRLTQLSSLDLKFNGMERIKLPDEIVQFSEFTALTRLHLRVIPVAFGQQGYDHMALHQLNGLSSLLSPGVLCYV